MKAEELSTQKVYGRKGKDAGKRQFRASEEKTTPRKNCPETCMETIAAGTGEEDEMYEERAETASGVCTIQVVVPRMVGQRLLQTLTNSIESRLGVGAGCLLWMHGKVSGEKGLFPASCRLFSKGRKDAHARARKRLPAVIQGFGVFCSRFQSNTVLSGVLRSREANSELLSFPQSRLAVEVFNMRPCGAVRQRQANEYRADPCCRVAKLHMEGLHEAQGDTSARAVLSQQTRACLYAHGYRSETLASCGSP